MPKWTIFWKMQFAWLHLAGSNNDPEQVFDQVKHSQVWIPDLLNCFGLAGSIKAWGVSMTARQLVFPEWNFTSESPGV